MWIEGQGRRELPGLARSQTLGTAAVVHGGELDGLLAELESLLSRQVSAIVLELVRGDRNPPGSGSGLPPSGAGARSARNSWPPPSVPPDGYG
jgi:hypothetical protein